MISFANGDIFNYVQDGDIVLQQVNCEGVMGNGLALQIRKMFPNVYESYKSYCKENDYNCLGDVFLTRVKLHGISFTIGNCFGQESVGTIKVQTDYKALKQCFKEIKLISHAHHRILIPYGIGCGLGGGDWRIVSKMIEDILGDCDVLIVKYNK